MALFGKITSAGTGNGVPANSTNAFNGVLVANTGAVSLTTSTQQVALLPIANYYGLPESRFNITITQIDTMGATAGSTPSGVSTAVYELQLYGKSGSLLYDSKGQDNDFINDAHLLNPYGYYVAESTPTPAVSSAITTTFSTIIGLSIDASEFPVNPVLTLNTLGSRYGTLNGTTTTVQAQIWMDFEQHSFVRAKLRSYNITGVTTGVFPVQSQLDKNVNVLAQGFYFATDANLAATSSINFANNGVQLINQSVKTSFIAKENSLYPGNAHITGFFPLNVLYPQSFNSNYGTVLQFNVATAPTIGGVANVIKAKLLEAY